MKYVYRQHINSFIYSVLVSIDIWILLPQCAAYTHVFHTCAVYIVNTFYAAHQSHIYEQMTK